MKCSPCMGPNLLVKIVPAQPWLMHTPDVPLHKRSTLSSHHLVATHGTYTACKNSLMHACGIRAWNAFSSRLECFFFFPKFSVAKLGVLPLRECGPYTSLYGYWLIWKLIYRSPSPNLNRETCFRWVRAMLQLRNSEHSLCGAKGHHFFWYVHHCSSECSSARKFD